MKNKVNNIILLDGATILCHHYESFHVILLFAIPNIWWQIFMILFVVFAFQNWLVATTMEWWAIRKSLMVVVQERSWSVWQLFIVIYLLGNGLYRLSMLDIEILMTIIDSSHLLFRSTFANLEYICHRIILMCPHWYNLWWTGCDWSCRCICKHVDSPQVSR